MSSEVNLPEQLELRAPPERGGPMNEYDWRMARAIWDFEFSRLNSGSIKNCRALLQLSMNEMARRLQVKTSTYAGYEKRERKGTIKLAKMREIACAMNCEFVYKFVPKDGQPQGKMDPFAEAVWNQLTPEAMAKMEKRRPDSRRKAWALAAIAKNLMQNAKFRRSKGWTERLKLPIEHHEVVGSGDLSHFDNGGDIDECVRPAADGNDEEGRFNPVTTLD